MRQWGPMSLEDLARHSCIEHNASLAHRDCREDREYAPTSISARIFERLTKDSSDGIGLTLEDIARARVRREKESLKHCNVPLDRIHAEIARGEMALVVDIFGKPEKESGELEIGIDVLHKWWMAERFPEGWAPQKRLGLLATIRTAGELRADMRELEKTDRDATEKTERKERKNTWRKEEEKLDFTLKKAFTDEKLQLDEKAEAKENAERV